MKIREKIIYSEKTFCDKIIVRRAKSLENQIRFYLDYDLYVAATEQQDGRKYKVSIESEIMDKIYEGEGDSKKETRQRTKVLQVLLNFAIYIGAIIASVVIGNWRFSLLMANLAMPLTEIINNAIFNFTGNTKKLRSKHSAEHMMVKFIEANNRMPVNISELRKYSRFSLQCGSRFYIQSTAEIFSTCVISAAITIALGIIIQHLFVNSDLILLIISILIYLVLCYLIIKLSEKHNRVFEAISRPIKNILVVINQLTCTTSKVREQDLVLAYLAARQWMIIVYPEFYDRERDDTILRENIGNIEVE